jgi:diguanylate cyclase (GGDEF)-like protein/PAS domain S-box-containing protein
VIGAAAEGIDAAAGATARAHRCEAMLAHPGAAVAIVAGGRIVAVNARWRSLFAMATDKWVDKVEDQADLAIPVALFASVQVAERFDGMVRERLVESRSRDGDGAHAIFEHPLIRCDGTGFLGELFLWPLAPGDSQAVDAIWQVRDVTAERALHAELRDCEAYHRALAEHQRDMTFVIDRKGRITYVSPSVDHTLGYPVASLLGRNFTGLLVPEDRAETERWFRQRAIRRALDDDEGALTDYRLHLIARDGGRRVLACHPHDCFDVPRLSGMVLHARDMTDEPERALRSADPLTSLVSRVEAGQRLAALVAERTSHAGLLVLVVNLDRTRDINDRHGHAVGDRVIAEAARRLSQIVEGAALVARVDGDEFLVALEETDSAKSDVLIQAILDELAKSPSDQETPRVEASIGAARLASGKPDGDSLWRKADLAMREAKERGRGQAVFFHPRLAAAIAARSALGAEIEDGLKRAEFALFYQPQVSLATGRLVGLEALLRWEHPARGLLLPHVFIEAAIECGLIDAVTKVVFGQVCDQLVRWQRQGDFPEVPVSVNVSAQQFHDRRLPALVASALLRTGLPARLLILELTEQHLVVDSAATERVVKELTMLGVRIAIGSFGPNHASLRSLHQLRVSQIKLDRGFVEGLPVDSEGAIVVDAALEIGRRLKCQVIAEGVETRAQFECLRAMGCEAGQGFYFGAPLSAVELESFVAANRSAPAHWGARQLD